MPMIQGSQGGDAMQAQADAMRQQAEQLRAQAEQFRAQMEGMREQMRAAQEAARAAQEAQIPSVVEPDVDFGPPGIPQEAVDISIAFFVCTAAVIIFTPLMRAWARRMDRSRPAAAAPDVTGRLDRIEQAVDSIAIEVERVSEGQRFTTRLMTELRGLPAPDPGAAIDAAMRERAAQREAVQARGAGNR